MLLKKELLTESTNKTLYSEILHTLTSREGVYRPVCQHRMPKVFQNLLKGVRGQETENPDSATAYSQNRNKQNRVCRMVL
jgi:hypothetical protein